MQIPPLPARVTIPDHVLFQIMGSEVVLLNTHTELYFGLDEVAAMMWKSLSIDLSTKTAVDTVLNEYDSNREAVEKDLSIFLNQLKEKQLIDFNS